VTPRAGKFQLTLHKQGLVAHKTTDPSNQLIIPKGAVSHMVFFPKPEDILVVSSKSKKASTSDLVLIRLEKPITFQNKEITVVCIQLPFEKKQGALWPNRLEGANEVEATQAWSLSLRESLGTQTTKISHVLRPPVSKTVGMAYQFSSSQVANTSSTTAGMPFVRCYQGVNDGVLYPLEEGLLFFK
jgi:hypothetical protein